MTQHTKEPWHVEGDSVFSDSECIDKIAHVLSESYDETGTTNIDARRIVACVNACEGLSDNFLSAARERDEIPIKSLLNGYEEEVSALQIERDHLAEQNAELLAALERIVTDLSDNDEEGLIEHTEQMMQARAAIANAEQKDKQ